MSSSTNNSTDSSLFVSSNPTPQTSQQPSWWRRGLSATSNLISGTAYYASRPVAWALNPIGDGLASGVVSGGQRELTTMLQPNGSVAEQVRTLLTDALIKKPPQELYKLKEILDTVLIQSEPLTPELAKQAHQWIALLNEETLQRLVPDLSAQGKEVIKRMQLMFQALARNEPVVSVDIKAEKEDLEKLSQVIHVMVERQQGSLVQAMAFLHDALVGNESGLIGQAIDILKSKLLDTTQSSLTKVEKKLSQLFGESPDSLKGMLNESEKSVVDAALVLLRQKTTASTHAPQEGLKEEEKVLIKQAIGIAKSKITLQTNTALQVLLDQLNASTGLLHTLRNALSIEEQKTLLHGQALLQMKLDPTDAIATPWTQDECILLETTLQLIAEKHITSHEACIKETIDLIRSKREGNEGLLSTLLNPLDTDSDRLLEQAATRLQIKWAPLGRTSQKLAAHQFKAADHPILKAIQFLKPQLQNKQISVFRDAQGLVQDRLSANESTVTESKRLNASERLSLQAIERMISGELASREDLVGNYNITIQSQLNAALKILQTKNTTPESALQAITLEQLSDKLKREMTTLSKLESGLTDPATTVLLPLLKTAQEQLIADKSPLASLEAQIDSQAHDIITQAIDLLNEKLFEIGGPIDGFRRTLIEEGGILDQALRLLNTGLLDSERGVLSQAATYLKTELTQAASDLSTQFLDGENGIFAKAINLLNKKLQAEDGLLATLDTRLNDEEHGILAKAAMVLDKKLNEPGAFLDRFNARLNAAAHPKISSALIKAKELKDFCLKDAAISQQSEAAAQLLLDIGEILRQKATIFKTIDLRDHDLEKLTALERQLRRFGLSSTPISADIQGVLTEAIEVLNHHHHNQQGIAARTGQVLVDQLQKALVEPQGLIDRFNDRINATAHSYLLKARKELADLHKAYEQGALQPDLLRLSHALATTLGQIDLDRADVFAKSFLRCDDLDKIHRLEEQLSQFTDDTSPSQDAMRDHFHEVGEMLNHHCLTQAGIIARTTDNLAAQFSHTLLQPNGPLDQFSERLNGTTHPALTQCASSMALLKDAMSKRATKPHLYALATNLIRNIDTLQRQRLAIFTRAPLRDADLLALANLRQALTDFTQTAAPSVQDLTPVFQPAIEVVNHHVKVQGGIITGTAKAFADQLTHSVMQEDGIVEQLGKRLTDPAHAHLSQAREALIKLQTSVMQRTRRDELIRHSARLTQAIQQLIDHQDEVFQDPPLRDNDIETLQALLPHLQGFQSETLPKKEEILPVLREAFAILNYHFHAQAGYADKFTDAVVKGLDPLLARFERLPRAMYDAFMGRDPEAPGQIDEAPPVEETEQVTIGSYLQKASEYLGHVLTEGTSLAWQKAVTSVAGSLLYALEGSLESIEGREDFTRPREMLKSLIAQVTRLQTSGSITELQRAIKSSLDLFNTVKIYINGFRVPRIGTLGEAVEDPETAFLSNISQLRTALERSPGTNSDEEVDWKVKAQEEKQKFVDNTTKYLAIKLIYEQVCRLTPVSDHMYFTLIRDAARQEDPSSALKDAFFRQLQNANVGWFKRAIAHAAYFIFSYVLNRFIQNLSSTYLEEAFKFIDENKDNDFLMLKNMLINNFTRYLTILGGAYERIAHNPQPGNRLSEMLKWELDKPECNLGQSTSDLYSNFAAEVINKCTGNRFVSWLFKKFVGNEETIVNAIVNQSIGSLMDTNGYTHALNCVVVEQLQEVLTTMQEEYAQAQRDGTSVHQDTFSKHKKSELTGLVKNLFEVLQKSKCQTKDELRDVVDGKSLAQNAVKLVDALFIQDVIENVTNIIALTIGDLVKEDQLHKLTYKFTKLVNTVYEAGESYTLDEVSAKERELTELTDRILNLSILTAVEEKFDFTGTKEQQETNRQIGDLRRKTEELTEAASRDLEALAASPDLNSVESTTKLKTAMQEALAYETECSTASFEAKGSQLSADNKEELKVRYLAVAQNSGPYIEQISRMRNAQKQIEEHAQLHPKLQAMLQINQDITRRLCDNTHTLEDMSWARAQIEILEHHLEQANRIRNQAALTERLTESIGELASSLNELHHLLNIMQFALEQGTVTSLATQIVDLKKESFGALILPATIRKNIELLKTQIRSLNDDNLSRELFVQIEAIQNSSFQEKLDSAFAEFRRLSLESFQQSAAQVNKKKEQIRVKTTRIQELINGSHLLDMNYVQTRMQTMRESLVAARQSIDLMKRSCESADARLVDAETKALALKKAIKTNIESAEVPRFAAQLSASIQTLMEQEDSVFERSALTVDHKEALLDTQFFLNELQHQAFPEQDAEAREEIIERLKKDALRNLAPALEILSIHTAEQSQHNAFKPVAYVNKAFIDMNSFKNWATELVFGRVKDHVDGLMQFIRREDTYKFGLTNHMLLIPYLQHARG